MDADPLFVDEDEDIFIDFAITPLTKQPKKRPNSEKTNAFVKPQDPPISKMVKKETKETRSLICPICSNSLGNLNEVRRLHHINGCLDTQETDTKFELDKEKASRSMDCPICRKPLDVGPFRIAHLKKCAKEHKVSGSDVVKLFETQKKVTAFRKENGLRHNGVKSPIRKQVKAKPLKGNPRSLNDEQIQLAKALSASLDENLEDIEYVASTSNVSAEKEEEKDCLGDLKTQAPNFSIISEFSRRARKRRSYDVVAFTPENCACKQSYELNARFLDLFKIKCTGSEKTMSINSLIEDNHKATLAVGMKIDEMYSKLARLSKLSSTLGCLVDVFDPLATAPIRLVAIGGGFIYVLREILKRRTTTLNGQSNEIEEIDIEAPLDVMREWLRFVYASKVEWTHEKNQEILKIAEKYGPEELPAICREMNRRKEKNMPPKEPESVALVALVALEEK